MTTYNSDNLSFSVNGTDIEEVTEREHRAYVDVGTRGQFTLDDGRTAKFVVYEVINEGDGQ